MQQNIQYNTGTDHVGNNRCNGNTGNAHPKADDQYQIEDRIDNTRCDQCIQRSFTVSCAPQDRCAKIIKHDTGHTKQIDPQI